MKRKKLKDFPFRLGWKMWAVLSALLPLVLALGGCQTQKAPASAASQSRPLTAAEVEQQIQQVMADPNIPAADKQAAIDGIKRGAPK